MVRGFSHLFFIAISVLGCALASTFKQNIDSDGSSTDWFFNAEYSAVTALTNDFGLQISGDTVIRCPAGKYSSNGGCVSPCSPGAVCIHYAPAPGLSQPIECPPGMVADDKLTTCVQVSAGSFRAAGAHPALCITDVDGNVVFSYKGASQCELVPEGVELIRDDSSLSSGNKDSSLSACLPGSTSPLGSDKCSSSGSVVNLSKTETATLSLAVALGVIVLSAAAGSAWYIRSADERLRAKQKAQKSGRSGDRRGKKGGAGRTGAAAAPAPRKLHLRRRRTVLPAELESPSRYRAACERVCSEANVPIADVRKAVDQAAAHMVGMWSEREVPTILARRLLSLMHGSAPQSAKALRGLRLTPETATPASADLLLEQMRASPYFVLCNPLNYRGTAWPFPGARMLFDKLFSFQDDETGVEDASTTLVRRMYMLAVAEQSAKLRETLATGTAADLAAEPSLTAPMRNLLDSARAYSGTVDVTLSATGKSFQLLADEENVTRALRNAPLHLASAIRMSPAAAQIPVGNALEAIRVAGMGAVSATDAIVRRLPAEAAGLATHIGLLSEDRAPAVGYALTLLAPQAVFSAVVAHIRASCADAVSALLGDADVTANLFAALERLVLPLMIANASSASRETLRFMPNVTTVNKLAVVYTGNPREAAATVPLTACPLTGAAEGRSKRIQDAITSKKHILTLPAVRWGPTETPCGVSPTIYVSQ